MDLLVLHLLSILLKLISFSWSTRVYNLIDFLIIDIFCYIYQNLKNNFVFEILCVNRIFQSKTVFIFEKNKKSYIFASVKTNALNLVLKSDLFSDLKNKRTV